MSGRPAPATLDLGVDKTDQLFNEMDAGPFHKRDLAVEVVEYIVDWAQELAPDTPLQLSVIVHDEGSPEYGDELICDVVHSSFLRRAVVKQREMSKLLREGRISLVIAITFLAAAILISDYVGGFIGSNYYALLLKESVGIGIWVALWHPLNIFLYGWWPIRAERRLFEKLGQMPIDIAYLGGHLPSK
jgi:hypothetical protein